MHHGLGKLLEDAVVTSFIGIREGRFGALLDADMIKLAGMCVERTVDIAQAAFLADLSKEHACQLVPALEMLAVVVSLVFVSDELKLVAG